MIFFFSLWRSRNSFFFFFLRLFFVFFFSSKKEPGGPSMVIPFPSNNGDSNESSPLIPRQVFKIILSFPNIPFSSIFFFRSSIFSSIFFRSFLSLSNRSLRTQFEKFYGLSFTSYFKAVKVVVLFSVHNAIKETTGIFGGH